MSHRPLVLRSLVFLVAMCLRPMITTVGPLLDRIGHSTGLGPAALGLLGALPLLGYAAASPLASFPADHLGVERTVLISLLALVVGVAIRSSGPVVGLWLGTAVIGASVAIGNVLVPALVKGDFADHVSLATGVSVACLACFAGLGSGLAIPIDEWLGSWRAALAVWGVLPVVVAVLWTSRLRTVRLVGAPPDAGKADPASRGRRGSRGSLLRSPAAWSLTLFMGLQSLTFYLLVTWLPTIEASFGIPLRTGGLHLFVFQILGIPLGMGVSVMTARYGNYRFAALIVSVPVVVAAPGLWLWPGAALLWILVFSLASGAALTVAFALVAVRARDPQETARLSGMTQSVGYLIAAAGPFAAGILAQVTGSWVPVLLATAGVACLQSVVAWFAGRTTPVLPAMEPAVLEVVP